MKITCASIVVALAWLALPAATPAAERASTVEGSGSDPRLGMFAERWGLGIAPEDRRFDLRPHQPTYLLLARHSDGENRLPTSPAKPPLPAPLAIQDTEAKFQLSFKVKLADFERRAGMPLAIWAAYTQQSHWQVYDVGESRPFRETNYEPEVFVATHPDREVLGWRWRLAAVGLNHQSNGRAEPLSRSWNRVLVQFGFERGAVGIIVRPWLRVGEDAGTDDNPDITRYLGHGDLTVVWAAGAHRFALGARLHPGSGKGALQGQWSFPLARRVRGLVQAFSGYGESLIDYNVRQSTIGVGVSLADAL
jgi:phospholipase A1